jgi:hypothetical protein
MDDHFQGFEPATTVIRGRCPAIHRTSLHFLPVSPRAPIENTRCAIYRRFVGQMDSNPTVDTRSGSLIMIARPAKLAN